MGDPSSEMDDAAAAERGDITRPGGVQDDSAAAFEAVVDDEARAASNDRMDAAPPVGP